MRGIAAFYGGFPEYAELKDAFNGEGELTDTKAFYASISIFIVSFILSSIW